MASGVVTYCCWATMARPIAMMVATMPSIRSVRLVLGRLEVAGGVLSDGDVGSHPAGHRVAPMRELVIKAAVAVVSAGRIQSVPRQLTRRGAMVEFGG